MDTFELLQNAAILYALGLMVVPNLPLSGRLRRVLNLPFEPLVRAGLGYRWSMYSPDAPRATQIAVAGVRFEDGSFEAVPLEGLDDGDGFGKARGLRFVAFQWGLCDPKAAFIWPGLAEIALRTWREREAAATPSPRAPVAVEIQERRFHSPPPGVRDAELAPEVRTLWSRSLVTP